MPPGFYYNEGTGRSYIDATRIDCSQLNAANVSAKTVSSSNLSGGAQNGLGPQVVDYLATTTSSNSYAIINKPALAQVALTGSYLSLVGTPNLSNVAVTGSYRDLANVPSFANVAFTNSYNSLSNLPALSQVAYTGSYANLTGRPANLTSFNNDLTTFPNNLTTAGNVTVTKALAAGTVSANLITLPNASFTGQYSELKGLPVANSIAANTLSLTANVDYPVNITENYTAGANGYSHPLSALNPTQSTGEAFVMQVGQTASTYAASYFGHVNQGAANSYATIGLYGQDRILNVTANKQVGINTTNPQYNLDVVGNAQVSSLITAGGRSLHQQGRADRLQRQQRGALVLRPRDHGVHAVRHADRDDVPDRQLPGTRAVVRRHQPSQHRHYDLELRAKRLPGRLHGCGPSGQGRRAALPRQRILRPAQRVPVLPDGWHRASSAR